jgi:hypothetical protein
LSERYACRAELRLQDAGADANYLLEALLQACEGSLAGGALMAWTNASGVAAFLDNDTFTKFIRSGQFELVVGLDSITDTAAIKKLIALSNHWPGLSIRAFMHDESVFFHPKLVWFTSADGLTLIVGSGNLTMGGLKGNWEAFVVTRLVGADATAINAQLAEWLSVWDSNLIPIDDPRVLEKAANNAGSERALKKATKTSAAEPKATDAAVAILIAEIPRSKNRWSQANFDVGNYEHFFGAQVGTKKQVLLYHVRDDGTLDEVESRPSVQVKSHNYRFEIAAARGLPYPTEGRPIGVFMRLSTGAFLYVLLLPEDSGYITASTVLADHAIVPSGQMRRYRMTAEDLKGLWPDAPLWQAKLPQL